MRVVVRAATIAASIAVLCACGRTVRVDGERSGSVVEPSVDEVTVTLGAAETVTARVSQTLRIVPPDFDRRWRIDYASDVLAPLTPADQMERPPGGWRFRAQQAGETHITVTAVEDGGGGGPPAVARFGVAIRVVR